MTDQNGKIINEQETNPTVVEISPSTFIHFLHYLSQHVDTRKEIDERFKNVRCFRHILGSSTSFKLKYNFTLFAEAMPTITSVNNECEPIVVSKTSTPKTLAMSLSSKEEPAFLSYVKHETQITVFCVELPEPIGRIVKTDGLYHSDIICLATDEKFTMKMMENNSPAAMCIEDSNGKVVAVANVSCWTKRTRYTTSIDLDEFQFQVKNGLSEAARVILFVAFVNWTKLANRKIRGKNYQKVLILFGVLFAVWFIAFLLQKM